MIGFEFSPKPPCSGSRARSVHLRAALAPDGRNRGGCPKSRSHARRATRSVRPWRVDRLGLRLHRRPPQTQELLGHLRRRALGGAGHPGTGACEGGRRVRRSRGAVDGGGCGGAFRLQPGGESGAAAAGRAGAAGGPGRGGRLLAAVDVCRIQSLGALPAMKSLMGIELERGWRGELSWKAYGLRFAFGGLITAITGLIAHNFGPVVGGLFLAFPAILPASVTLIEDHDGERAAGAC